MGWFDEQIKLRKQSDDDAFADSFVKMAGAVMGEKVLASLNDDRIVAKNEIDEILKFYHVKSREVPDSIEDMNEQLEYLMRPYGIMRRTVYLEKGPSARLSSRRTWKKAGIRMQLVPCWAL